MRDQLVEKYQYYMTEAARLQELADAQNEYILALEQMLEAVAEHDEHTSNIVDHNARVTGHLGGGNKPDPAHVAAAKKIVANASSAGHTGLGVDETTGHIHGVHTHVHSGYDGHETVDHSPTKIDAVTKAGGGKHWGRRTTSGVHEGSEADAQKKLDDADRDMKDIMPGVKAKNRPMFGHKSTEQPKKEVSEEYRITDKRADVIDKHHMSTARIPYSQGQALRKRTTAIKQLSYESDPDKRAALKAQAAAGRKEQKAAEERAKAKTVSEAFMEKLKNLARGQGFRTDKALRKSGVRTGESGRAGRKGRAMRGKINLDDPIRPDETPSKKLPKLDLDDKLRKDDLTPEVLAAKHKAQKER